MFLIDSHCHLDFPDFDNDREELIHRCVQQGVQRFLVPGVTADTWERLQKISRQHSEIIPAYGLHPYFVGKHTIHDVSRLSEFIEINHSAAIGEIGLDYYDKSLDREQQKEFFFSQLDIAKFSNLPVVLHVRKAHDEVISRLKLIKLRGGIVHAFNGSLQQAKQYCDLGFVLGFGGTILNPNAVKIMGLLKQLPIENIVLETDSPDMTPLDSTSSRNTPLTVVKVAERVSQLRDMEIGELTTITSKNFSSIIDVNPNVA